MKIFGSWGRFDAPYVEARFVCRRFGIDAKILFLMEDIELYFESDRGFYRANHDHIFVIKDAHKRDRKVEKLIPSLLGRDFLNQMALLTDKRQNLVLITDEILTT